LEVLDEHTGWVQSVAFSPNGAVLVSGGNDQTIRFWDVVEAKCLRVLQGGKGVTPIALSSDGQVLVSGGGDETIKLWNFQTGECFKTLRTPRACFKTFGSPQPPILRASKKASKVPQHWGIEGAAVSATKRLGVLKHCLDPMRV
jgi:WD40 repeat protein